MTTDKELLELAAKAAGLNLGWWNESHGGYYTGPRVDLAPTSYWNPLTDSGDAFRLVVKLGLNISTGHKSKTGDWSHCYGGFGFPGDEWEKHGEDPCAATRRAIVRAAAELGKAKP